MHRLPLPAIRVAIVDEAPHDYGNVLAAIVRPDVSMHFMLTGHDAIRFARRWHAELWVINSRLCDMTGFELADTIRSLKPNALIFMIGDEYCLDDEMQTLTLGFAKYVCKPLEPAWILPQSQESCIPMRVYQAASRSQALRLVAADALTANPAAESGEPLSFAKGKQDRGEVILPFNPQSGPPQKRRPAA